MGRENTPFTVDNVLNVGNNVQTIVSMEVAEMVGKQHKNLLADIRNYVAELNQLKIQPVDFFIESTYIDGKGEKRPCFDVTKKGCEFIAHKLTGIKGTEFTARYINRFHDMECYIENKRTDKELLGLQFVKFIADDLKVAESSRLFMYETYCKDVGIPTGFLPKYEDNGNRERNTATELLNRNGCELSTVKFNKLLLENGYLEEKERKSTTKGTKKYKVLTDKGLKYGVNLISDKNQKETQPYYYADVFMELYRLVYCYCEC